MNTVPKQTGAFFTLFRPLLTVEECCRLLADASADMVSDMLDSSALRGVDIASNPDGVRRQLRIYRWSVEHALLAPREKLPNVPPETTFPHERPIFRRDEVAAILNCTPRHITNLRLPGPSLSPSASPVSTGRSARFTREGLIQFLNEREIHE